jgi:ComF family protein
MAMSLARTVITGLVDLVYPPACLLCDAIHGDERPDFCSACREDLMKDRAPTCPRCGATVGLYADTSDGCRSCRDEVLHFAGVMRLGTYEGKLREAVLRIKCAREETLARALGRLLLDRLSSTLKQPAFEAVAPVPLHWLKRLIRGYNQSFALALPVARGLRKPISTRWLWRCRYTPEQTGLTASERRASPRQAFRAKLPAAMKGRPLLLVDDVLTTGSTASAAAHALRAAGSGPVWVAVLATS